MSAHLWSSDKADFIERIAKLAGKTTFKEPVGGRTETAWKVPDEHAIAQALAYARRGADDIGPDVAYCWVLGVDAYKAQVTRRLSTALRCHRFRFLGRHRLAASEAAWEAMVHDRKVSFAPPKDVPQREWDTLVLAAIGTLHTAAWDSLAEAERCYRRSA